MFKLSGDHLNRDIDDNEASLRKASGNYGFSHEPYVEQDLGKKVKDSANERETREIQKAMKAQKALKDYYEHLIKSMGKKG